MKDTFEFFKTSMPPTRPADFYLGCLDGSVFLDFNHSATGVSLVRISFDGYGCCDVGDKAISMNKSDSNDFLKVIALEQIDQKKMADIVCRSLQINQHLLWVDALQEYGFLEGKNA
ncbi:hypothetical protein ACSFA0_21535 [Variovorax sp. LT1P1]|uniref:hypothetical protein n=1 Tax=Variovorax sp. LT1P1 TaxID=3443730 RepID=UPI003F44D2B9